MIQSIEQGNMNTQILLLKKIHKTHILNKFHLLIKTLKGRNDFSGICGNSDGSIATIDKFLFSKSGYNYLTSLKGIGKLNESSEQELTTNGIGTNSDGLNNDSTKKRPFVLTKLDNRSTQQTNVSPIYKKANTVLKDVETIQNNTSATEATSEVHSDIQSQVSPKCYAEVVKQTQLVSLGHGEKRFFSSFSPQNANQC